MSIDPAVPIPAVLNPAAASASASAPAASSASDHAPAPAPAPVGAGRALALATLGFALNCWAWALLSPLGPLAVERGIAPSSALMVAIPVLVGSLGRIPVGALTDRFGGRTMFSVVSLLAVVPVLLLGFIGQHSYPGLLLGGFLLGTAGTVFAIGIPYVTSWFPPERRGRALGIFGMSMGGTAISAFTTVPLVTHIGDRAPFVLTAAMLVAYALVVLRWMPTAPTWSPSSGDMVGRTMRALRHPVSLPASYLYAVSFGGYVAFTVLLPTLLGIRYGLSAADASFRMAGFVVVAVLLRPVGGILADRLGAARTLLMSYAIVAAAATALALPLPLMPLGTLAFLAAAGGLGLGTGAVFALVGTVAAPTEVGAITGLVGAAGGLGGFLPPLLMAAILAATGAYTAGFALLALGAVAAGIVTLRLARR
ncbi:MFS transporter [Brachybacterium sp. DNPG3]